jgi:hypothetical protein
MRLTLYKDHEIWMIDFILEEFGFPTVGEPVVVEFGLERTHPDMVEIRKLKDTGDDWALYEYKDCQGALCPVTLLYLGSHPDRFYARPVRTESA